MLDVSAASPLRLPRRGGSPPPDPAAAVAALAARGVDLVGDASSAEGAAFREGLEVVARPDTLIRARTDRPGEEPDALAFIVSGDRVVSLFFAPESGALRVGKAGPRDELADALAREATHEGPLCGQHVVLWPSVLRLLTLVWGPGRHASASFPRAEAARRLEAGGMAAANVAPALQQLVDMQIVTEAEEEGAEGLTLNPAFQPFLERAFSGHLFRVERLEINPARSFAMSILGTGVVRVFFGPPGQRILSDRVSGERLASLLKGKPASEEEAVRLSGLPAEVAGAVMRMLMGLEAS